MCLSSDLRRSSLQCSIMMGWMHQADATPRSLSGSWASCYVDCFRTASLAVNGAWLAMCRSSNCRGSWSRQTAAKNNVIPPPSWENVVTSRNTTTAADGTYCGRFYGRSAGQQITSGKIQGFVKKHLCLLCLFFSVFWVFFGRKKTGHLGGQQITTGKPKFSAIKKLVYLSTFLSFSWGFFCPQRKSDTIFEVQRKTLNTSNFWPLIERRDVITHKLRLSCIASKWKKLKFFFTKSKKAKKRLKWGIILFFLILNRNVQHN